jgi:hypothetical protein
MGPCRPDGRDERVRHHNRSVPAPHTDPDAPRWRRLLQTHLAHVVRARLTFFIHRAFVASAYRALLGRQPDPEGQRHFVRQLLRAEAGMEDIMRTMAHSPEAARWTVLGPGIRDYVAEAVEARHAIDTDLRPLCFLHIMKSGGTSLTYSLSSLAEPWPRLLDVWVDQLVVVPRPMANSMMLVTGHLPYGTLALLSPETATCTVLRDPLDRTLSHYAHIRIHGGQPKLTLEEFVHDEQWRLQWVDYQARQLGVDVPIEDAWLGRPIGAPSLQARFDADPGLTPEDLLSRASQRLEKIDIVGVSDDLDQVLRAVAALWRKPAPAPAPRMNPTASRRPAAEVPEHLRAAILAGTEVDRVLYEQARERAAG